MNQDETYIAELRDLPPEERYARLKELIPNSFNIGDIIKTKKRLAAQGVEVPWS